MKKIVIYLSIIIPLFSLSQTVTFSSPKKGFPSLFGQGADVITGGRGQVKFFITTLSNGTEATFYPTNGTYETHWRGSMDSAFEMGDDHIIPYIGGNIDGLTLVTNQKDNISYHGQLAPSGGLAIINGRMELQNAENVIVRYLTVRNNEDAPVGINDAVNLNRPQRIALDHMSSGWEGDEALSIFPGTANIVYENITIQRYMVGQTDQDNGGSKGALLGSGAIDRGETRVNMHMSIFNASHRTPSFGGHDGRSEGRFYNNVVYNWLGRTSVSDGVGEKMDVSHNYYKHNDNQSQYSTDYPLSFQMMNMPILAFDEATDTASFFSEGNYVENLLTELNADNKVLWTRWEHTNSTSLQSKNFRLAQLPVQPFVGYVPISAIAAKQSIIDDREVGPNRSTDENGNIVFGHDAVDELFFTSWASGTGARVPPNTWVHPIRTTNNSHQTDENWNGIYDGFETENDLGPSTESESSYSWKGITYVNEAGYDNFEVWSAIQGGAKDLLPAVSNLPRNNGQNAKFAKLKSL